MGLFDRFTEKKSCAICGKELGLLGKSKIEDGYLCKECTRRLSPFFADRRHSTTEQIKDQLAWREANKEQVERFRPTREFDWDWHILIDDNMGAIIVSDQQDWRSKNPDVISFGSIRGCNIQINENRRELFRQDSSGTRESYNPPRYESDYDFWITIQIGGIPYFNSIRIKLNDWTIRDRWSPDYARVERQANEIRDALREIAAMDRNQGCASYVREVQQPQQPSSQPSFCSSCGAPAKLDARFCESCGSPLA